MGWWSRSNDRMAERELRSSWRGTLVRALIGGLVGAVVGAVGSALQGQSWVGGAVLFGWLGVLAVLLVRVLVLSDARNRPRRRD